MTATPDIIPSDLTLEITENLSPERFMEAARAFFGYIKEIGHDLATEGEEPKWIVSVKEGSTLLAVDPIPNIPTEIIQAVYSKAQIGVERLRSGNVNDSGLSEAAMKHLRILSELAEGSEDKPNPIRLWVKHKPVEVSTKIADVIREDWRTDYTDYGTIEGKLESIKDKEGSLQLQIRDALMKQVVRCYVPEELLDETFKSFRKRVEVYGEIHYRRNGTPVSIHAAKIEQLPDDDQLPSLEAVRGIFQGNA